MRCGGSPSCGMQMRTREAAADTTAHVEGYARTAQRTIMFPFSPEANLGGFGLLRNGETSTLEIMAHAGSWQLIHRDWEFTGTPPIVDGRQLL